MVFLLSPTLALLLITLRWATIPLGGPLYDFSVVILVLWLGLGLYPLFLAAWASNRAYATIGALRGVAQTISYEVSLALILMGFLLSVRGLSIELVFSFGRAGVAMAFFPLLGIWLISGLAETNRTPFDFSEGERELVSGFNIEYGSGGFVLIFLAEYAAILLMGTLTALFIRFFRVAISVTCGVSILICYF